MGGAYWDYFVPYTNDINEALQRLREQVFREGSYSCSDPDDKPETIEELLEQEGESGTNSILDITHVSDEPEFAAITPMPAESLLEIFGTEKPTHEMVESKRGHPELTDDNPLANEGWQGAYITVYRGGKPDEIYFVGSSGDH